MKLGFFFALTMMSSLVIAAPCAPHPVGMTSHLPEGRELNFVSNGVYTVQSSSPAAAIKNLKSGIESSNKDYLIVDLDMKQGIAIKKPLSLSAITISSHTRGCGDTAYQASVTVNALEN